MESTWESRDLPVLDWVVTQFNQPIPNFPTLGGIADGTGIDVQQVALAAQALDDGGYITLKKLMSGADPSPWFIVGVSAAARRAVGQWPTPENTLATMIRALNEAAEAEPDPAKKSKLKAMAEGMGDFARELLIHVLAAKISGA